MKTNEQNHYAVAIVKRTAGCNDNQGSWPQAKQQHVASFSEVMGNIKCTITGAKCSFNLPQGGLEVPNSYTAPFW